MRIAWFFILGLLILGNAPVAEQFVIKQKEIKVKGITSFGTFECSYGNEKLGDTLYTGEVPKSKRIHFVIEVEDFGCGNFLLNRDFKSTIKASEHPTCLVTVNSLNRQRQHFLSNIDVNLAGKFLSLEDVVFTQKNKELTGVISLSFDQLDLEAPKKFGGLIQVDDNLVLEIILGI
ncbi:MAG TPA: hypothetical protein VK957_06580 [Lunatimonas sp.]|nr:hypothetical protein [Lunatimonas sp.]